MRWTRRLGAVLAVVSFLLVATALVEDHEAAACSCIAYTLDSAVADGTAAFVGTAVDRRVEGSPGSTPVVLTFDVAEVVKGELPSRIDVWTGEGDGDCGAQVDIGELVGIVLQGDSRRWTTSGCGGVWLPDELRAPGTVAAPTGSGPVALIAAGRSGPAMLASFDDGGNLAAWGLGDTTDEMWNVRVCPGSTIIVGTTFGPEGEARVVRRDVSTLLAVGTATLPERPAGIFPSITDTRGFHCTSPDGNVAFLVSASGYGDGGADNVVVWVDGASSTTYHIDHGWGFAVAPDGTTGYLLTGEHGTLLERITLADGSRQLLTELPDGLGGRYVAVDTATGRIAVIATSNPTLHSRGDPAAPDDRLVVLDAGGAVLATVALPDPRLVDSVTWMDGDRLLVVWGLPSTIVDVITLDGMVQSSVADLTETFAVAVAGERLYAAGEDGVVSMTLDGRDRRLLAPSIARVHTVVAVPAGPAAAPQPAPTTSVAPPEPPTTPAATVTGTEPPTSSAATSGVTSTEPPTTTTTSAAIAGAETGSDNGPTALIVGAAIVVAAVLAGATAVVRRRRHALHLG
ncbi:MAG TPA: hypothetical protein VFV63_14815 [Ilumatobacteraceae bacterium]|nr:hypothetical protein [Ilumatobacteraceae bacterium]